jgi:threonine dehydrogenase-like Zn-dependent dehydrogenase
MRAAVVAGTGRIGIVDAPEPVPDPYQAVVRTLAGGLCGTDRHIVAGTFYRREYPAILGHESIGVVTEVGSSVRHLQPGDLILRTAAARPGERLGDYASMHGAFAEWALATDTAAQVEDDQAAAIKPFDRLQKVVPAGFDPIDAGAFIGLKEALSWLTRLTDVRGRTVLVVGTGPAAMAFVQVAKLRGAERVIVLGRRESRLALALRLGADDAFAAAPDALAAALRERTDGRGIDVAIDAAGTVEVLEAIPDGLAHGGILGVYGISAGQAATIRWGWDRPTPRSWSLRFEEPDEAGAHDEALELVRTGRYQLKSILTHVLPFDQVVEAFATMDDASACKVAIDFRDGATPR